MRWPLSMRRRATGVHVVRSQVHPWAITTRRPSASPATVMDSWAPSAVLTVRSSPPRDPSVGSCSPRGSRCRRCHASTPTPAATVPAATAVLVRTPRIEPDGAGPGPAVAVSGFSRYLYRRRPPSVKAALPCSGDARPGDVSAETSPVAAGGAGGPGSGGGGRLPVVDPRDQGGRRPPGPAGGQFAGRRAGSPPFHQGAPGSGPDPLPGGPPGRPPAARASGGVLRGVDGQGARRHRRRGVS